MTIYNYLEFFFIILLFFEISGKYSESRRLKFFYTEALLILFVLGLRNYNVGGDTPRYVSFFLGLIEAQTTVDFPIGFDLLTKILRVLSLGSWGMFLFYTSLIALIPFLYFVKKESTVVTFSFLCFLLCWRLLWLLETPIKQTTAIFFIFVSWRFYELANKRDKKIFYLYALIFFVWSLLTHTSMILIFPLAVLTYYLKFEKSKSVIIILLSIFLTPVIKAFIPSLLETFNQLTFAYDFLDNINNYQDEELLDFPLQAYAPQAILTIVLIAMGTKEDMNRLPYKFLIVATIMNNLGMAFPLMSRVYLLFSLIGASVNPSNLFYQLKRGQNPIYTLLLMLLFVLFYYFHYQTCANFKYEGEWDILPYSTWLDQTFNVNSSDL